MQVNYKYASPSVCVQQQDKSVLGLSPDLSREEKVSFKGKLKHPLVFRDAMLMLREIVISDTRQQKKERIEYFAWLEQEIERRMTLHEKDLPGIRKSLQGNMDALLEEIKQKDKDIGKLVKVRNNLSKELEKHDAWRDYYKLEREFWKFIKDRDSSLWFVLDPVITVHPDQVSFEAFSLDESTYGCLSIPIEEFELIEKPLLGTTNIDFSAKLAKEMERFRTYTDVELSVNPGGFVVDTGITPEYVEKKIDLPETWIKGFNQVSAAASLGGVEIELDPVDMYDICSFLRRHKANKSPRYLKWILEPGKNVRIVFEPFGKEMELNCVYSGEKKKEEKIWGSRRWLVIEKIIPLAKAFKLRLLGFGMPQFIIADLGVMKMTVGFTSWSSNDWVKGTAFNIMGGFIGDGNHDEVYSLLKEHRYLSIDDITSRLNGQTKNKNRAGIGMLLKRGEGYFDPVNDTVRFRQLLSVPIDSELYQDTPLERNVQKLFDEGMNNFRLKSNAEKEFTAFQGYKIPNVKYKNWNFRGTEDYNKEFVFTDTSLTIDQDGEITKVSCNCKEFNRGAKNISDSCSHILALYVTSARFLHLELKPDIIYKIDDILEMLL
ncbi:MAG: hypothetical protein Q8942_14540 [Bacillota bacterium]|nr:hypothetical protein [Bacillota bacterium]